MPIASFFHRKVVQIVKIMIFCAKVVNMATLIGPKWAHKQIILISAAYFEGQRHRATARESLQPSEPDR